MPFQGFELFQEELRQVASFLADRVFNSVCAIALISNAKSDGGGDLSTTADAFQTPRWSPQSVPAIKAGSFSIRSTTTF